VTTQIISEYEATDFVPGNATKAEVGVQSRPSENTPVRLLLTDFKTSAGSMAVNSVVGPIQSAADAAAKAGPSSRLARAYRTLALTSTDLDVYFGCVEEPSGDKAYADVTIGGSWVTSGWLRVLCDGDEFIVTVGASDSTDDVAAAIQAKAEANTGLSFTATASSSTTRFEQVHAGTLGNNSILYIDVRNAPAGLTVTLEPPEGALVARVAELRSDVIAHLALTAGSVHGAADSGPYTIASAPTNYATALTVLGQLLTVGKAHVQKTAGSVHGASDTTALSALNALTAPTTPTEAVAFAISFATIFFGASGHAQRTTSSIHGAADTTNVITSAAPTSGAVTGNEETGTGVRFASGTGTEDVSSLLTALGSAPWCKVIVVSSLDTTNLGLWETWSDARSAPLAKKPSRFVLAHTGNQAAATAISKAQLNHEAFEVLWGYDAQTPSVQIAAAHAVQRVLRERNAPALGTAPAVPATEGQPTLPQQGWNTSYSGTVLKGVKLAADRSKCANDHATQKAALRNGLTPLELSDANEVLVVRAITTKCQDADGSDNYRALEVSEYVTAHEVREAEDNAWKFFRKQNPYVRDNFAANEPVTPGAATPKGFDRYLSVYFAPLATQGVFESPGTARSTFNRSTKRIQTVFSYTRMPLNEQGEALIQSLAT